MATEYLRTSQAAKFFGVCAMTIRRWARAGRLPAAWTPGGHRRFDRRDCERLKREDAAKRERARNHRHVPISPHRPHQVR